MSIRDDMIQKVVGNPGKYSIQQLQAAVEDGTLPAYVVVPIIQDKVQQQKQMQAAMQAQQEQPPQSTIAEEIMQEAQGVEQLPSNLPEQYASGGIVAFANNEDQPVSLDMPGEDIGSGSRKELSEFQKRMRRMFGLPETLEAQTALQSEMEARRLKNLADQQRKPEVGVESLVPPSVPAASMSAAEIAVPGMGGYEAPVATPRRTLSDQEVQQIIAQMRARGMRVGLDTYKDIKAGRIPPALTAPETPTASAATAIPEQQMPPQYQGMYGPSQVTPRSPFGGLSGIMDEIKALQEKEGIRPTTKQRFEEAAPAFRKLVAGIEASRKEETDKLRGQVTGKAYEGLESELRKEAEQMGVDKETARNMAIFKAGLAMMAGTSRNALENIGKGAMVGAEDYQRAASEIKKAQKENQRMMANIEQARRAEQRGDIEKQIDALNRAKDQELKVEEYLFKGVESAGIKDEETVRALFKDRLTVAGQMGVAGIQAKSREDLAALRAELSGPKGALTEYQKQTLLSKARAEYPIEKARIEYAKSKGYSRTPKLGEDQEFDGEANRYWMAKIHTLAGLPYDSGAASRTQGQPINYRAAGYNVLGQSQ